MGFKDTCVVLDYKIYEVEKGWTKILVTIKSIITDYIADVVLKFKVGQRIIGIGEYINVDPIVMAEYGEIIC